MDDTLRFGDIVCLYSEDSAGFVYSYQSSAPLNEIAVGSSKDGSPPPIADHNIAAFEICIANRYKLNKYHRKLLQSPNNSDEVPNIEKAAQSERKDNEKDQERQQGKTILYGSVIQLRHLFTGKYIHVDTSKTSVLETLSLAVCLKDENAKNAQFRIMPRYKVKDEGDWVQVNDQIVLESVKSPRQYLHVSCSPLGPSSVYQDSYELNLSPEGSGFTVHRKHKPSTDDKGKLKVGDFLRLYHKELEAYLVAEGVFDEELEEDVHLRTRPVDPNNPNAVTPSSSAVTYWMIELEEGLTTGGVVKWKERCRIIHMCTRRYLKVTSEGQVTMTSDCKDPSTIFCLHSVINVGKDILFNKYCHIQHAKTGKWLHAVADDYISKAQRDEDVMNIMKHRKAKLKKIEADEEKRCDDAFAIEAVAHDLEVSFHHMAGTVPFLQKLVRDAYVTGPAKTTDVESKADFIMNSRTSAVTTMVLKEMAAFMIVDNVPSKSRQKLMRNLRIVDLLIRLLQKRKAKRIHRYLTELFVSVYCVLDAYLKGSSRKNELYMTKHIEFFITQLQSEDEIGLSATQMVKELIQDNWKVVQLITHDHIDKFILLLSKVKNYRYLELLSVLCVCDGVAITENQNYITEAWLDGEHKNCYLTELGHRIGKSPDVLHVTTNGRSWMTLEKFAEEAPVEEKWFLEHQLELFGMLCYGRNESCIDAITKRLNYLTWEEAFKGLTDETLQPKLRAKYCKLIITLFLDITNTSFLGPIKHSFIYDDIGDKKQDDGDSSNDRVHQLRDWVFDFLEKNGSLTANDNSVEKNMFIQQVLRLVHFLLSCHGPHNIGKLLEHMMSLLKVTDKGASKEDQDAGRFQESSETQALVNAKLQALKVVDLIIDHTCNKRMEKFLCLFKNNPKKTKPGRLKKIFDETELKKDELSRIMLDLAKYPYDEMVRKSLHLLNRYFSAHQNLFNSVAQVQVLITNNSVETFQDLERILPSLRRLATVNLTIERTEEICGYLECLSRLCTTSRHSDPNYQMNQNILYSQGVLDDCLSLLCQGRETHGDRAEKIHQKTFILLKVMAHKNKEIQMRLFDTLDILLSKEAAPVKLAECVTEVFTGNFYTCMKIKRYQIQNIVALVAKYQSKVPQFLDLLSAIVKVEELGLPLKQNQSTVMTCLRLQQSKLKLIADLSEKDEKKKYDLLKSMDSKEVEDYVLSMVDLMTTCAEGENRFIESICQKFFSITFLMKVVEDQGLTNNQKRPFLRFLYEVYMCAAGGVKATGADDLTHNRYVWYFIQSVNKVLIWTSDYAETNQNMTNRLLKGTATDQERNNPETEEMGSTLRYLFEAVFPFLRSFFKECYNEDSCPSIPIIQSLAKNVVTFRQKVGPLMRDKKQIKVLMEAGLAIITRSRTNLRMEDFQTENRACKTVIYQDQMKEEVLKKELKEFSEKLRRDYEGANNVRTQIGLDKDHVYFEDDGDEKLPLGVEYQDHLKCFIDDQAKEYKYWKAGILVKQLSTSATLRKLTEKEKIEQAELDVKCLQLLRGLVHNEIVKLPEDWEKDVEKHNVKEQLKVIESVQNELNSHNMIEGILEQLAHPKDSIVREILALLAALLFNGNEEVQKSFAEFFDKSEKENFFNVVQSRMQISAMVHQEKQALKQALQAEKAVEGSITSGVSQTTGSQAGETLVRGSKGSSPPLTVIIKMEGSQAGETLVRGSKGSSPPPTVITKMETTDGKSSDEKLDFKDDGYIRLVLRILALMCDNINTPLQNYLREQRDNIKSVDLVAETTQYLKILYSSISEKTQPLIVQLFHTLVEFTSGNIQNQRKVFDNKICEYINYILRVGNYKLCNQEKDYELKMSIAKLIRAMTEENWPRKETRRENLATAFFEHLDTDCFLQVLRKVKDEKVDTEEVRFAYYHILCRMADLQKVEVKHLTPDISADFEDNTLSIEIVKDGILQKLYFRVRNQSAVREEIKEKFNYKVDRSSPSKKLRDLMDWSQDIIADVKYQRKIQEMPITGLLAKAWRWVNRLVLAVSIALVLMILITCDGNTEDKTYTVAFHSDWRCAAEVGYILAGIHNILSLILVISYLVCNNVTMPDIRKLLEARFLKVKNKEEGGDVAGTKAGYLEVKFFSIRTFYYIVFLLFSVFGTTVSAYFFAVHILHMVMLHQIFSRIKQAVTKQGLSLVLLGFLGCAILFLYAVVGYAFFRDELTNEDGAKCETMSECYLTMMHHGLIAGVHETMKANLSNQTYYGAASFNVSFFLIITTIGNGILFGIIIDTFAELRDEKFRAEEDMRSVCFICSLGRHHFERQPGGFEEHVKKEHNQWTYLLFFIYMDEKRRNDYSALEFYVASRLKEKKHDFFPLYRAMSLTHKGLSLDGIVEEEE